MNEAPNPWLSLMGRTVIDAAGVGRDLNAMRFPRGTLWMLLVLVSVLSVLLFKFSIAVLPLDISPELARINPFGLTIILGSGLILMVFAIYFVGQVLGGQGRFPGALLLIVWWQVMAMALQLVQTLLLLVAPVLAGLVSIAGFVFMIYTLLHFVNELHGFDSLFKSLATVFLAVVGIIFGLSLILTLIGVTVQGGIPNV